MSVVVTEISLPSGAFELGTILHDHGRTRIELTQFVPSGAALAPYFWAETDDYAAFEAAVRNDDRVATLTVVNEGPNKRLYHIEWADPLEINGLLQRIHAHDLIVESGVGTDETWRFRLRARDHESLTGFQESCATEGIEMTVHRVWTPTTGGPDPNGLTQDQREALVVAARLGYFETPSRVTLTEIGDELGISSQAASKRIRGGVEKLVTNAVFPSE